MEDHEMLAPIKMEQLCCCCCCCCCYSVLFFLSLFLVAKFVVATSFCRHLGGSPQKGKLGGFMSPHSLSCTVSLSTVCLRGEIRLTVKVFCDEVKTRASVSHEKRRPPTFTHVVVMQFSTRLPPACYIHKPTGNCSAH